MKIAKATPKYELWLSKYCAIVEADLSLKHQRMAEDLFSILHDTFYRWVDLWEKTCPELARAPILLAVGDLHVENFGTWRDREGRLVWVSTILTRFTKWPTRSTWFAWRPAPTLRLSRDIWP